MRPLTALPFLLPFLFLGSSDEPWPGVDRLAPLLEEHELFDAYESLAGRVRQLSAGSRAERIPKLYREILAEPLLTPGLALELTDELAAAAGDVDLDGLLRAALRATEDVELGPAPEYRDLFPRGASFLERMDAVVALLEASASEVERGLAALEPDQRAMLRTALDELLDQMRSNVYVLQDPAHVMTWELFQSVDVAALTSAAGLLAPLADRRFGEELRDAYRADRPERPDHVEGVDGKLLYARETALGWVLVGAAGDNAYDLPVAFLFDLGGDDTYQSATTRSDLGRPVNVVIDLEGDDAYEGTAEPGQACGLFGVSLVVDQEGRDRYAGAAHVQGCGIVGVGMLVDRAGDDVYLGDVYAQGAGCFGVGLCVDLAGDDEMTSHLYSQGFGAPASFGLLVDVAGADTRHCRGVYPSSYGTANEFNAFSQGCGFGLRTLDALTKKAAGGVGVLLDGGGNDTNRVGEFGHGIGYFYGVGIARDLGGDDTVTASRYGIATGAHYGVGVVLDDEGDDRWRSPYTASIAGNWDLTYSFFLDRAGDDEYLGAGISLGSATITSLACFIDGGGEDEYRTGGANCFGNAGHPQDLGRGSRSLALFLDLGGGRDAYPTTALDPGPRDGLSAARRRTDEADGRSGETGVGVFLDE